MKKFQFTLQSLRTLRLRKERQAMENYARALLEKVRAVAQLQAAEQALAVGQWDWQQRLTAGCTAVEMVHHQLHCRELAARHNRRLALTHEAEGRAEAALQSMMMARQEREVVDKFYDRQRIAYDRELTRSEQKFLDEFAHRRLDSTRALIVDSGVPA